MNADDYLILPALGDFPTRAAWIMATQRVLSVYIRVASGCIACAEHDPTVLEYNHVETPGTGSRRTIATVIASRGLGFAAFEEELAKCVVMCSNCHRRYTAGTLSILPTAPRASSFLPSEFRGLARVVRERSGYIYSSWKHDTLVHVAARWPGGEWKRACVSAPIPAPRVVLVAEIPDGMTVCTECEGATR